MIRVTSTTDQAISGSSSNCSITALENDIIYAQALRVVLIKN
jgi:hypothetical protein